MKKYVLKVKMNLIYNKILFKNQMKITILYLMIKDSLFLLIIMEILYNQKQIMKENQFLMKMDNYKMIMYNFFKIFKIKLMIMGILFWTQMDSLYLLIKMEINLILFQILTENHNQVKMVLLYQQIQKEIQFSLQLIKKLAKINNNIINKINNNIINKIINNLIKIINNKIKIINNIINNKYNNKLMQDKMENLL